MSQRSIAGLGIKSMARLKTFMEEWNGHNTFAHPPDFLAASEYPDPPNFCAKSARKITAAVNAAEFVKFGEPQQKLWLTFGWV